MNPNSIPKQLSSWVYYCLAAILIASTAFGQPIPQTGPPSTQAGGAVTINDAGNGSPYPSTVLVTNYSGHVTRVTVTLAGVTHGYPDDIDVVLESPSGDKVVLMSDVGGQNDVNNVDLTFDSSSPAAPALPDETQISSGRVRPTNNNPAGDTDPAIATGAGTDLSVFVGENPTGLWRLYVSDDNVVDAGSIRSWTLTVFTEPIITITNAAPTTAEDTAVGITVVVNDSDTPDTGLTFTAVSLDTNLVQDAGLTFSGTGTNRTLNIQPRSNQTGTGEIEVRVSDGIVTRTSTIDLTVTAVNDRPTIALNTPTTQVSQGGISTNILATVGDVDHDPATLTLAALSSNPSVVPASNVFFSTTGTNTTRYVRISPAANAASGTATITVVVSDASGATNTAAIDVTVTPVSHVVAGNPAAITIPANGTATPYPSTVSVANVSGLVGKVTVTLLDFNHDESDDAALLLVGPTGQKVVLMRGVGGTSAVADQRIVIDDAGTAPDDNGSGNFPATAPAGPYSANLSAFNGTNPNGTWSLFVYDAENNAADGAINGGWALNLFPAPVVGAIGPRTTTEDTPITVSFAVSDQDGSVTNVSASVTDQYPSVVSLSTALNGTTGSVTITPDLNQSGTNIIRVVVQDNSGFRGTNDFSIVITPVNDLPTQTVIPKQIARAGQSVGPISFTVGDVETAAGSLEVRVSSNNPKLLPPGSIVVNGSGASRTITIFPAGAQAAQADVTVTVVDANNGSTSQTFDLTVNEAASPLFENVNPIQVNDGAAAAPYPSVINVSGLSSTIAEVQVTLFGITHPNPDDLDIMLVSPTGATLVVMSDSGGAGDVNNNTLIFRDSASAPLGDETQIVSGTFQVSNVGVGDDFPVGSSPNDGAATSFAAAFNGLNPNGDWRLFIVDDTGDIRGGVINGWQLSIRTRPVIADIPDQTTTEDTQLRFTVDLGDAQPGINYTITSNIVGTGLIDTLSLTRSGDSLTVVITPVADASGTNLVTITVQDPDGVTDSEDFNFIVTPRNDAPRFSDIPNSSTPAATPITIAFTVSDVEGSAVTVTAESSNAAVVPNSAITVSPSGGTTTSRSVTILPEGIATGDTVITLTGNDGAGGVTTETFTLSVTPNVSFANTRSIAINDFAAATPYPSTISVSGVVGTVSDVSVTLLGFTHQFPDDVDVLLVSPDNRRVMLTSDSGGGTAVSGLRLTFRDGATSIPDNATLTSGVFGPRNWTDAGEGDETALPSPAPAGPYGSTLGSLAGVNPNGEWRLFVRDDTFGLTGEISGGWILIIETGPTITQIGAQTTQEDVPAVIPFTVSDQDTVSTNLDVTISFSGNAPADLLVSTNIFVTGTGNDRTLTIRPTANLSGTNLITLTVEDENETSAATSFAFRVTPVDDPSTISLTTNVFFTNEDAPIAIPVTIGDIDSTVGGTNVTVTSSNTGLVPNSTNNITVTGEANDDGDDQAVLSLNVTPAGNQNGSTTLSIVVRDAVNSVTNVITLNVTPVNDAPIIATSTNQVFVQAGGTSGIVNVRIDDIETLPRNLTLSAQSLSQSIIPNSNILLGGSDTNRTAQFIALSTVGTATIQLIASDGSASTTNNITVEVTPAPGSVFANAGAITIRDNNTANPYPSTIIATGMRGPVSRVSVTLDGFAHTAPDDVDILLVHRPTGRKSLLLSDVGGANAVSNLRLIFDARNGNRNLVDDSPITSGTFLPSDYESGDVFPAGAPAGPYTANLGNFNGVSANGEWDLYVVDDAGNNSGQIAFGWSLRIETAPTITLVTPANATTSVPEDTTALVEITIDDMTTINGLALSYVNSNPSLISSLTQTPSTISGPDIDLTVTPVANASGTNVLTITVTRPDNDPNLPDASSSVLVTNIFTPVNDLPTMSRVVPQSTQEDVPVSFDLLVADVDNALTNLTLTGTSGNTALISNTNILLNGITNSLVGVPSSPVRVTLQPNAGAVGSGQITLTLTEQTGGQTISSNFTFTVSERNDRPIIVNTNSTVAIAAGASGSFTFQASDPEGLTTTVTATSADQALVRNADIVITPAASVGANRTATITTQPGVQGRTTITMIAADPSGLTATNVVTIDVRPTRERIFSNTRSNTINDNSTAADYPSIINVSGLAGNISRVTVTLHGLTHSFPDDVDMLLVSPAGQKVLIMSDMGGDPNATNITLKLDDAAADSLPNGGPLVSGTFKPSADEPGTDNFPSPAPAAPYAGTLAGFNGHSPNGDWRLYIIDDTASDSGVLTGGWSLGITTQPILVGLSNVTSPEDVPARVNFTVAEESFAGTDFEFSATSSSTSVVPSSTNNLVFSGTGTNRTITVTPVLNASGSSTITVTLRNTDGQIVSGSFVATFTAVNDAPTVSAVPNQTVTVGNQVTVTNFNYADVETEKKDLTVSVTSSNPAVIAAADVVVVGNDLTIISRGGAVGRTTITLTVTDTDGASTDSSFEVAVTGAAYPVFANTSGITIRDNTTADPYPSSIVVSNVGGTITKITVTLTEFRHSYPDDVDILLVGPGGQSVVLMSDAGAGGTNTPAQLLNARLTFDDAGNAIPDNSEIPEFATVRPSNYEGSETFTAPAPAGPYGSTLSVFNGTDANGTWSLYVMDDASPDAGSIGTWLLSVQTTAPSISDIPDVTLQEGLPATIPFTVNSAGVDPTNLVVTATVTSGTPIVSLTLDGTATERTLTITPRGDQVGSNEVTVSVTDGTNTASTTFTATVVNVDNDAPVVGAIADQTVELNEVLVLNLAVSDPDTSFENLAFFAATAGTNLVSETRFSLTPSNTVVMTITPITGASGTETVTVSVSDGENITRTSFTLEVESGNRAPVIAPIANVQTPEDVNVNVRVTVSDAETALAQLVITGESSNTNLVSSVAISNDGTQVQAAINLVPNRSGTANITIRASDGTNTTSQTFSLVVIDIPDSPIFAAIPNQTAASGATTVTVPLTITDADTPLTSLTFLSATAGTEIVQSIAFNVTGAAVDAVITLRANATGTERITLTVSDGDSVVRQSFDLVIGGVVGEPAALSVGRDGTNFRISLQGTSGATYVIEGTADFRSWIVIGSVTIAGNGTGELLVPLTGRNRFFRARSGPAPEPPQPLVYEGYDYPIGTQISTNENGGTGWSGAWVPDAETPNGHTVLADSFQYVDASGRGLVTTGGKVFYTATNLASGDVRSFRTFGAGLRTNGTTWISFIGQRMGPTVTNTGTPNNLYPRAANLSFYEGGSERFAIGNGSGAVSNLWSILPAGSVGNVTNDQRSATPMHQQAFIVLRVDHIGDAAAANDNLYMWINPPLGSTPDVSTASARSVGAFNFSFDRVRPFVGAVDTANNRPYAELALDELRVGDTFASVTPHEVDLTQPFNAIQLVSGTNDGDANAGAPPAAEGVERVIDGFGQKYLNFLDLDSGFVVTPLGSTVVNGLRFWPANDATERDPASYKLEGSTAGPSGPFTLISEGPLNLSLTRNPGGATTALSGGNVQVVRFSNTTPYTSYRVTFPTLRNAGTANSMQIAEVDFLGNF